MLLSSSLLLSGSPLMPGKAGAAIVECSTQAALPFNVRFYGKQHNVPTAPLWCIVAVAVLGKCCLHPLGSNGPCSLPEFSSFDLCALSTFCFSTTASIVMHRAVIRSESRVAPYIEAKGGAPSDSRRPSVRALSYIQALREGGVGGWRGV